MTTTTTTYLDHPQISSLDVDGLKDLPLLSCLDLSNNNIHQVPPQLGLVTSLRCVSLCMYTTNPCMWRRQHVE